ncbi:MAG: hypothetical protein GVY08_07595 [Bacteroidetes bacterium]|jgi:hypothetical protein|nr:hypothetical protein [Bacteroidota bacterium]
MSLQFIFTSGIIVVILFLIGLFFTIKEFKEMEQHPEDYRRRYDSATIDKKKRDS